MYMYADLHQLVETLHLTEILYLPFIVRIILAVLFSLVGLGGRYLVFFFKTDSFEGELHASEEGSVEWVSRDSLPNLNTVSDFMDMLKVFDRDDLTEFQYVIEDGQWNVVLK